MPCSAYRCRALHAYMSCRAYRCRALHIAVVLFISLSCSLYRLHALHIVVVLSISLLCPAYRCRALHITVVLCKPLTIVCDHVLSHCVIQQGFVTGHCLLFPTCGSFTCYGTALYDVFVCRSLITECGGTQVLNGTSGSFTDGSTSTDGDTISKRQVPILLSICVCV